MCDSPNKAILKEIQVSLDDNESNSTIELFLSKSSIDLTNFDNNLKFMLICIRKAIETKKVNETELRKRAKLMDKYLINGADYCLLLLLRILDLCKECGLDLNEIDKLIEILENEKIISSFIRSHWTEAKTTTDNPFAERYAAINTCLNFIVRVDDYSDVY